MASELPEYNKRIISMQALAPVAYLNNLSERTYIQFLVKYYELLRKLIRSFGVDEFAINNKFLAKFSELACKNVESSTPILCKNLLFLLDGYDSNKINCVSFDYNLIAWQAKIKKKNETFFHIFLCVFYI